MSLNDRYRPRLDDEEVGARVALGEENVTVRDRAAAAEPPESRHLALVEARRRAILVGGLRQSGRDLSVCSTHGRRSLRVAGTHLASWGQGRCSRFPPYAISVGLD
jgi:hypothetical protein